MFFQPSQAATFSFGMRGSPDVSQISEHCNEIRSFEVGEIVPAE